MQIQDNHIVRFHYSVTPVGAPEATESSFDGEPIAVLIGHGNIIPGLEQALKGRQANDRFEVTVPAEQAYGERREGMTQRIPKKYFAAATKLRPGHQTQITTRFGPRAVTVLKVGLTAVDVDLNHPLAGQALHFDVSVLDVRAASEEEIAHRHVHGEGGHVHD